MNEVFTRVKTAQAHHANHDPSLRRLFGSFLRMGITAFGGPAMIAYIRKMAVVQKKWLDAESFQDGVALCQTIPGATVMQMAAYIGLRVRGVRGAVVSYIGFGLPAFLLMLVLSFAYARAHTLPAVVSVFSGLQCSGDASAWASEVSGRKCRLKWGERRGNTSFGGVEIPSLYPWQSQHILAKFRRDTASVP